MAELGKPSNDYTGHARAEVVTRKEQRLSILERARKKKKGRG